MLEEEEEEIKVLPKRQAFYFQGEIMNIQILNYNNHNNKKNSVNLFKHNMITVTFFCSPQFKSLGLGACMHPTE